MNTVNEEDEEEEMEEEEEDDRISYTEEQAELINTLLAQVKQINKAVRSEKRPYEKKKPEALRKKSEVVVEIPVIVKIPLTIPALLWWFFAAFPPVKLSYNNIITRHTYIY